MSLYCVDKYGYKCKDIINDYGKVNEQYTVPAIKIASLAIVS
jgi:hypothetical protein